MALLLGVCQPLVFQGRWGFTEGMQFPCMLEDSGSILVKEAAHVAVLPWDQPLQETDVATPGCNQQCNIWQVCSSL